MAVSISYDLSGAGTDDHARIVLNFERLGWASQTGSEWRHQAASADDVWNQVIPGLFMFRRIVLERGLDLAYVSLDFECSGSRRRNDTDEAIILPASLIPMVQPKCAASRQAKFSERKHRRAIAGEALMKSANSKH